MANNNQIQFQINGDVTGLQRALQAGQNSLNQFGNDAGGAIGDMTSRLSGMVGGLATSFTGLAGAAAVGAGGLAMLVNSSREYVSEMNEVSRSTGLSVVQLQQLSSAFAGLGLSLDSYGSWNKDALDKLGDAFRVGGGIADDLKEYGLKLNDYNEYLNQADGGLKAVVHTFYAMRDAGKSMAETVNVLESLASDSSHAVSTLNQFANATEAMNYLQSQNAAISNETAKNYAEFDTNLTRLTGNIKGTIADGLNPLVKAMNSVYEASNQKPHEAGLFEDLNERIKKSTGSLRDMFDIWQQLRIAGALNYQGAALHTGSMDNGKQNEFANKRDNLNSLINTFQNDMAVVTAPQDGWRDKTKDAADAAKKAEQERNKAAAAQRAADAKRLTAQRNLEAALSQIGENAGDLRLKSFERQQAALIKNIQDSAKTLGLPANQLAQYIDSANQSANFQRTNLLDSMIGYTDPNQGLKDTNRIIGTGLLNDTQRSYLVNQQNQRINGDDTTQLLNQNTDEMNAELAQNELLLKGHEDYEKRKAEITAKYSTQALEIQSRENKQTLSMFSQAAGDISDVMAASFGKTSGFAKAFFLVQKGLSIAMATININEALTEALTQPGPIKFAQYATIASMGASLLSNIVATSGQFHGGIDELPSHLDNKSFLLQKGERVVQAPANAKLSKFLDAQEKKGSSGGDITVNAPLIINGSMDDDAKFSEMLKKHQNSVVQAVRNSQKRNS
jgi:hypothetical protein